MHKQVVVEYPVHISEDGNIDGRVKFGQPMVNDSACGMFVCSGEAKGHKCNRV